MENKTRENILSSIKISLLVHAVLIARLDFLDERAAFALVAGVFLFIGIPAVRELLTREWVKQLAPLGLKQNIFPQIKKDKNGEEFIYYWFPNKALWKIIELSRLARLLPRLWSGWVLVPVMMIIALVLVIWRPSWDSGASAPRAPPPVDARGTAQPSLLDRLKSLSVARIIQGLTPESQPIRREVQQSRVTPLAGRTLSLPGDVQNGRMPRLPAPNPNRHYRPFTGTYLMQSSRDPGLRPESKTPFPDLPPGIQPDWRYFWAMQNFDEEFGDIESIEVHLKKGQTPVLKARLTLTVFSNEGPNSPYPEAAMDAAYDLHQDRPLVFRIPEPRFPAALKTARSE
jgi:hypothetical protein